jgi:hypothetical protein
MRKSGNPSLVILVGLFCRGRHEESKLVSKRNLLVIVLSPHFSRAVTRELPNNFPFIVKKYYIGTVVERWDSASK